MKPAYRYPITDEAQLELERLFGYRPAGDVEAQRYHAIALKARSLAKDVIGHVSPGRERDVACQRIQEALMWCERGIARERS